MVCSPPRCGLNAFHCARVCVGGWLSAGDQRPTSLCLPGPSRSISDLIEQTKSQFGLSQGGTLLGGVQTSQPDGDVGLQRLPATSQRHVLALLRVKERRSLQRQESRCPTRDTTVGAGLNPDKGLVQPVAAFNRLHGKLAFAHSQSQLALHVRGSSGSKSRPSHKMPVTAKTAFPQGSAIRVLTTGTRSTRSPLLRRCRAVGSLLHATWRSWTYQSNRNKSSSSADDKQKGTHRLPWVTPGPYGDVHTMHKTKTIHSLTLLTVIDKSNVPSTHFRVFASCGRDVSDGVTTSCAPGAVVARGESAERSCVAVKKGFFTGESLSLTNEKSLVLFTPLGV